MTYKGSPVLLITSLTWYFKFTLLSLLNYLLSFIGYLGVDSIRGGPNFIKELIKSTMERTEDVISEGRNVMKTWNLSEDDSGRLMDKFSDKGDDIR